MKCVTAVAGAEMELRAFKQGLIGAIIIFSFTKNVITIRLFGNMSL